MRRTPSALFVLLFVAAPLWAASPPRFVLDAPRTYAGVLPCADCEGIRVTLDLFPDGTFVSRDEYLGKGGAFVDLGRWAVVEGGNLALRGGTGEPVFYWPAANGALRRLDREGKEIRSEANLELKPEAAFRLVEDPFPFAGLYTSLAGGGRLKPCLTRQELPVAPAGESAALERESAAKRRAPGAPVLVEGTARLVKRPGLDGKGTQVAVVVEKVGTVSAEALCPPSAAGDAGSAPRSPEGRTWKLVTLEGKVVEGPDSRRAAHLVLDRGRRQVQGSTGCNRLTGRYELEGERIGFSGLGTTRRACPDQGELEERFLKALQGVTRQAVSGERLTLYAGREAVLELREADLD